MRQAIMLLPDSTGEHEVERILQAPETAFERALLYAVICHAAWLDQDIPIIDSQEVARLSLTSSADGWQRDGSFRGSLEVVDPTTEETVGRLLSDPPSIPITFQVFENPAPSSEDGRLGVLWRLPPNPYAPDDRGQSNVTPSRPVLWNPQATTQKGPASTSSPRRHAEHSTEIDRINE